MEKRISYIFLSATVAAFALASCSIDEDMPYDGPVAARVSADIDGVSTRALDGSWARHDKIGISTVGDTKTSCKNSEYVTVNADGKFTPASAKESIFFMDDDENVSFSAYYPYTDAGGVIRSTTEDQGYLTDYLFAENSTASKSDPEINLVFRHAMTRLVLVLDVNAESGGLTVDDLKSGKYYLSGIRHAGTFDTSTGVATADAESAVTDDWQIPPEPVFNAAYSPTYKLIFYPQELDGDLTFRAEVAGQTFVCSFRPALEAYTSYTYNIVLKRTTASATSENINIWDGDDVVESIESVQID